MIVMIWKRDGLLAFFEIDERLPWRKKQGAGAGAALPDAADRPSDARRPHADRGLAVANITKNFGGLRALDDVSLSLKRGEILGLIGPNGSGKSTLINIMSGSLLPSRGRIVLDHRDISGLSAHRIARCGIGRTFQSIQLFQNLTSYENVLAGAVINRSAPQPTAPAARAVGLLQQFGLEEYADRLAGTLPYGQQRCLEIARAVAIDCQFLLLDEPAAGMIRQESDELIAVLQKIRARFNMGLLVVDHDLQMIMKLCDRVVVLNKGRVIAEGAPQQVQRDENVMEAYIGRKRKAAVFSAG
jgi:branched-chain amino acid transport system permease protein